VRYGADPASAVSKVLSVHAARFERRWAYILRTKGDRCRWCRHRFPVVVYDLHHPAGKASWRETPSIIIRNASEATFLAHVERWELGCSNCHRLHHVATGWSPRRHPARVGNCIICGKALMSAAPRPPKTCAGAWRAIFHGLLSLRSEGSRIR
jgi:hypothetical protein